MNVEEELINKIMMCVQKYVNDDDLPNVKDDVVCCVYGYEISEIQFKHGIAILSFTGIVNCFTHRFKLPFKKIYRTNIRT